ncbi:MAG: RNA polymerase sigma factor [Tannerellaceae bacterium]|jgi:RNA polymerase sigma-70 factor (ECF subfamily)|nr:RNA polymerase sigma factor [Tannerellaceae bacterium]
MSEAELAGRCRKGDNLAWKELYELYAGKMLTFCVRYTNDIDVAHDLLHDGFLKVYASISSFSYKGEGSLRAWLSKVFINVSLEYLRKKDLLRVTLPLENIEEMIDETETMYDEVPIDILMGLVLELPLGYRTVFNLYVFEEWSHKEIAVKLHINEKSSSSQLNRAKKILMKKVSEYINKKK